MISLTSDLESDSFQSDLSRTATTTTRTVEALETDRTDVDQLRKVLDLQGEKLNQLTNNNRELINVHSQLARLRSELEKSEMLRQTLEYELTVIRAQHGKQTAFTQQVQSQLESSNDQLKKATEQLEEKQRSINEKNKRIEQLENEAQALHEREKRIEFLNEQIHKMERTFSDSESISRKNLAQSILAKERQVEVEKQVELIQMKLEFSEQALEQERTISNEAKLNVQLMTNRLAELELSNESIRKTNHNQERKIDELERQISNEKLLRSTIAKLQTDLEEKCAETQKLIVDYEKQMKTNRDELSNFRRKFRNNEDKYALIVNKLLELLRLTKIINDNSDNNLPTVKQLEELKIYVEQAKSSKIELNNEVSRLKKSVERLSKSQLTQKQIEQEIESHREKFVAEIEQINSNKSQLELSIGQVNKENDRLRKELDEKNKSIESNKVLMKKFVSILFDGSKFDSNEEEPKIVEKQIRILLNRCRQLEEKLVERDRGTLQLTQKLEEQVLHLKQDFDHKHVLSIQQKDQLIQMNLHQIQTLNQQIQKLESRIHSTDQRLIEENLQHKSTEQEKGKLIELVRLCLSIVVAERNRLDKLRSVQSLLKFQFDQLQSIDEVIRTSNKNRKQRENRRFRLVGFLCVATVKFRCSIVQRRTKLIRNSVFYDLSFFSNFNRKNFLHAIDFDDLSSSLSDFIERSHSTFIANASRRQFSFGQRNDELRNVFMRLGQLEMRIKEKDKEKDSMKDKIVRLEKEYERRVDFNQFERICDELQRALNREKQAQDLLNEQNHQLKSLTDILHQSQQEKDNLQERIDHFVKNEQHRQEKISHFQAAHQQMEENLRRAEKAIRLVVSDKEQISSFCHRLNSALNYSDKVHLEQLFQLITQLDALIQLPSARSSTPNSFNNDQNPLSNEFLLAQNMAKGFIRLLIRFRDELDLLKKDVLSLKQHCQLLTEQIRHESTDERTLSIVESTTPSTVVIQQHPTIRAHRQSAFKPIKVDPHQTNETNKQVQRTTN